MWLLSHPSGPFIQYLFGSKPKEPFSVPSQCRDSVLEGPWQVSAQRPHSGANMREKYAKQTELK